MNQPVTARVELLAPDGRRHITWRRKADALLITVLDESTNAMVIVDGSPSEVQALSSRPEVRT